jgi:hypothetical protein
LFWHQVSPTDFHEDVKPSGTGKRNSINIDKRGKNTKGRKDKCFYPGYGISGHRPEWSTGASLHTLNYFLAEPTRTPDAILVSVMMRRGQEFSTLPAFRIWKATSIYESCTEVKLLA